jgi:hypothetical protein
VTEPIDTLPLDQAHLVLAKGAEFTAQAGHGQRRRRLRLCYAHPSPKGWEVTGWDGHAMRTYRADQILEVHLDSAVPEPRPEFKPPARRSGRR